MRCCSRSNCRSRALSTRTRASSSGLQAQTWTRSACLTPCRSCRAWGKQTPCERTAASARCHTKTSGPLATSALCSISFCRRRTTAGVRAGGCAASRVNNGVGARNRSKRITQRGRRAPWPQRGRAGLDRHRMRYETSRRGACSSAPIRCYPQRNTTSWLARLEATAPQRSYVDDFIALMGGDVARTFPADARPMESREKD